MRLVATGASLVPRGERLVVDVKRRARLLRMTALASSIGGKRGLVHVMAIEAAANAGVLRHLLAMTLRARFRIERGRAMGAVAITTGLIGVCADGVDRSLLAIMTIQARRRLVMIGAERMTVLAARFVRSRVQRRRDLGVAAHAQLDRRRRESSLAMTLPARELADVREVSSARADIAIRGRHLIGAVIACTRATDDEDHDQRADHNDEPIG